MPSTPMPRTDREVIRTQMYHGPASRRPGRKLTGMLALAALFGVAAVWIYMDLVAWEAAGAPPRAMTRTLANLYRSGGAALPAGLIGACGVGVALAGFLQFRADRATARGRERPGDGLDGRRPLPPTR